MKEKRGQVALEFLMTYGWAILVVLIAIAALAYFGVLNPQRFAPESCTISPGISCDDFKINSTSVVFILENGMGQDLTNVNVTFSTCNQSTEADGNDNWNDGTKLGGSNGIMLVGCSFTSGSRIKQDINVTYTTPLGIAHTKTGQVVGRVE